MMEYLEFCKITWYKSIMNIPTRIKAFVTNPRHRTPLLIISAVVMGVTAITLPLSGGADAITQPISLPCQRTLLIGHRGTSTAVARNNSMAAFQRAVADGAEVVELDIHRTKPVKGKGTWVVWHDKYIKGKKISKHTYEQLKKIQPDLITVKDAIAYVSTTGRMMQLEVKPKKTGSGSFKYIASLVKQYKMQSRFQLASFDKTNLKRAKKYHLTTVYLSSKKVSTKTVKKYSRIVHLNKKVVTSKAVVDYYHRAGIKVYVYTSDSKTEWNRYLSYGVDGITTDLAQLYTSTCNAQML